MSAKLSVVIPYYGVETYLAPCLDSVLAQTFTDFDCVLVDDGSLDRTVDIARTYAAKDSRIRIITQENQGLGPARNTGVRHTDGEYLMFLDSDDIISPRCFEQLVTSLDDSGSDFATANVWRWDLNRGLEISKLHAQAFRQRLVGTNIYQHIDLVDDRTAWNKMFRRSWYDKYGWLFPAIKFEDYPVTLPMHLAADRVDVLPDPVYVWRERESGDSISQQSLNMDAVRDRVQAAHIVCDALDDCRDLEIKRRAWRHLFTVDIFELLAARRRAKAEDIAEIDELTDQLFDRFGPGTMSDSTEAAMSVAVFNALKSRDHSFAVALAARRRGADLRQVRPLVDKITPKRVFSGIKLAAEKVTRRIKNTCRDRFIKAEIIDHSTSAASWQLTLKIFIFRQLANRLRYTLRVGDESWPTKKLIGHLELTIQVDLSANRIEPAIVGQVPVVLEGRLGPLIWRGIVQPGVQPGATLPPPKPLPLPSGDWVVWQQVRIGPERNSRPAYCLRKISKTQILTGPTIDETGLTINHNQAYLALPYPGGVIDGVETNAGPNTGTYWPWAKMLDPVDNPVDLTATRPILTPNGPLYYADDDQSFTDGMRTFRISRQSDSSAAIFYLDRWAED